MQQVRKADYDLWFESAKKGKPETLCKLHDLDRIGDVDIQDFKCRTALYLAAKMGHKACAESMLIRGANPNMLVSSFSISYSYFV